MKITCLCPTYFARPASLVANSIACFEAQTYSDAKLIVLDDTGHFEPASGPNWEVIVENRRHPTLGAKYNAMVEMAGDTDAICVWEDDDIYLPWHLEASAQALESGLWAHPSEGYAITAGKLRREECRHRFHAALSFRRSALRQLSGWPTNRRANFDLQLIGRAYQSFGAPSDLLATHDPSYVFRWESTGTRHGQSFGASADDTEWYAKAVTEQTPYPGPRNIVPQLSAEVADVYKQLTPSA